MSYVKNRVEKKKKTIPELNPRLQQISDEYANVNATYVLSPVEISELVFEKYKERFESNGSYYYDIPKVTRVQTIDKQQYFVYVIHEEIMDHKFQLHTFNRKVGIHASPIGTIQRNEYGEIIDTNINNWKPTFEIPWNTKEIQKLVQGSRSGLPTGLSLAKAATRGKSEVYSDVVRSVFNWNEWLYGETFSDLFEASRLRYLQAEEGGLERFKKARDLNLHHATIGGGNEENK
jgi:hypothetical protein